MSANGERLVSVDIGSTWTKGAVFALEGGALRAAGRAEAPTTVDDLARGFRAVRSALAAGDPRAGEASVPVYLSSSARGGLKIAALGLTADLTLAVARLAAASAGGRVVRAFAYELDGADVADLERLDPDLVLFTGGTDGGNSRVVLRNAERLAASSARAAILYAGNRKAREEVLAILSGKAVEAADNVMPEVGQVNIEPAREVIRRMFLERIVDGKGLSAVVREAGRAPLPTPLAVFELVRRIGELGPEWSDFAVVDMGGATTDFYSHSEAFTGGDGVVLRGLHEPFLKRSVEGDLGVRVSAAALLESERSFIESRLAASGADPAAFEDYVRRVSRETDFRPDDAGGRACDRLMAAACVRGAALRHAGVLTKTFTSQGFVFVQKGKDLRRVKKIVGTGGFLARRADGALLREACAPGAADADARPLVPDAPEPYADSEYLFPLLANVAADRPREAARAAVAGLRRLS